MLQPIHIPCTTPTRYLSFNRALNLRLPDELTGDWHFELAFFCTSGEPAKAARLAGVGEATDTTPTLGDLGVRDMAAVLSQKKVSDGAQPIYVANHFRAITDLALSDLLAGRIPPVVTRETVNQWLDTKEQVQALVELYLTPLQGQLSKAPLATFNKWLPTIRYR